MRMTLNFKYVNTYSSASTYSSYTIPTITIYSSQLKPKSLHLKCIVKLKLEIENPQNAALLALLINDVYHILFAQRHAHLTNQFTFTDKSFRFIGLCCFESTDRYIYSIFIIFTLTEI